MQKNFARSNPARSKTALDRLFLKVPTFCPLFSYLNDLGSFEYGSIEIPARSFHFFVPVTVSTTASIEFDLSDLEEISAVKAMDESGEGRHGSFPLLNKWDKDHSLISKINKTG